MTGNRVTWSASWNSRVQRWSARRSTSAIRSSPGHPGPNGSNEWNEWYGLLSSLSAVARGGTRTPFRLARRPVHRAGWQAPATRCPSRRRRGRRAASLRTPPVAAPHLPVGVGEAAEQQGGARPGGPVHRGGVATSAVVVEGVEQAAVDHGVEGVGVAVELGGAGHRELRVASGALAPPLGGDQGGG